MTIEQNETLSLLREYDGKAIVAVSLDALQMFAAYFGEIELIKAVNRVSVETSEEGVRFINAVKRINEANTVYDPIERYNALRERKF